MFINKIILLFKFFYCSAVQEKLTPDNIKYNILAIKDCLNFVEFTEIEGREIGFKISNLIKLNLESSKNAFKLKHLLESGLNVNTRQYFLQKIFYTSLSQNLTLADYKNFLNDFLTIVENYNKKVLDNDLNLVILKVLRSIYDILICKANKQENNISLHIKKNN